MTIAITLATLAYNAYNYLSKPSDPPASASPVGKEQGAADLFCAVGPAMPEAPHTLPEGLPEGLRKMSEQFFAEEKRLAESGKTISSPRGSELLIKV